MDKKKVVALEDRLPQLKKERKRKANRRFAFYASLFFFLILIVVYFQSPLSRVHSIAVEGEQIVSSDKVIKVSRITNKTHIWDIRKKAVAQNIEKLPTVRTAVIEKEFPNQVKITITEYTRKAYLQKDGNFYPILQNGAVLSKLQSGKLPVDAPVLFGFSKSGPLKKVAEGLSKISRQMAHNISDIHYIGKSGSADDLVLYMNDGNKVIASTQTFAQNIKLYPEIAANLPKGKPGTIHLSVGTYFIPNDTEQGATQNASKK
ncbi:FtsQ-type POTRA domain-containing protein [Sporolactobacillus shoreicorticis]|uniref:Cell division protein DivIB n=1 Tax=Sporolactobacillus shoreicorticis TaxID=1923877 RepID=A0ABW5S660_9BACL|nr:FtsQ-type POTRA domain-containing protein [Sporolactobacillus shoreicorticis]MCO7126299.1 FtsQ-type POTRA domain-containing protein [Sporolactobacillus shoreicorticis]